MIVLDKKEAEELQSLLTDAMEGEECFACFPDVGEDGCFHCKLNNMITDIMTKVIVTDQARATPISDNDFVLSEGGAWVEYKNVVLRIYSDEVGVGVKMCYKGDEENMNSIPLSDAFLCYSE